MDVRIAAQSRIEMAFIAFSPLRRIAQLLNSDDQTCFGMCDTLIVRLDRHGFTLALGSSTTIVRMGVPVEARSSVVRCDGRSALVHSQSNRPILNSAPKSNARMVWGALKSAPTATNCAITSASKETVGGYQPPSLLTLQTKHRRYVALSCSPAGPLMLATSPPSGSSGPVPAVRQLNCSDLSGPFVARRTQLGCEVERGVPSPERSLCVLRRSAQGNRDDVARDSRSHEVLSPGIDLRFSLELSPVRTVQCAW